MINIAVLNGRLTRDPDLRYTSSGTAVASFSLAVQRQFKNANGDREADFINCVIWRKGAEALANYAHKGSLIGIDGRIQTRNYENKQGERVYITEVVVENFSFLDPKNENQQENNPKQKNKPVENSQNSTSQNQNNGDPFKNQSIDISDDDLPF